jgi:hypothetical protein
MRPAVLIALVCLAGCTGDGVLRTANGLTQTPVKTPDVSEAAYATHARVDQVGRQILRANLFMGVEPTFQTIGSKDPLLFHADLDRLYLSDSLVERCTSDAQLAAVLCSELARMVVEQRNLRRLGLPDPPANVGVNNSLEAGGIPADQVFVAEAALREQKAAKRKADPGDPKVIAGELLKTAGFDPADLALAEPVLRGVNRNPAVMKQLAGPAATPTWSN